MKIDRISQSKTASRRNTMTFGEFVADVYRAFGHRRAKAIVQLAVELNVIKFNGKKRYEIS